MPGRRSTSRLPDILDAQFDIVYTSGGALEWLPDIARWGRVAAHFTRPGGFLYVTDIHPVAQAFENEGDEPGELRLAYPYWSHVEPIRFDAIGSYADPDAPTDGLVVNSWDHSLGEVVTSLADAGLRIDFLHEFDSVPWKLDFLVEGDDGRFRLPEGPKGSLPLYFSINATKAAGRQAAPASGDIPARQARQATNLDVEPRTPCCSSVC